MPRQVLMKVDGWVGGKGALIHILMPFMCLVVDRKQEKIGTAPIIVHGLIHCCELLAYHVYQELQ